MNPPMFVDNRLIRSKWVEALLSIHDHSSSLIIRNVLATNQLIIRGKRKIFTNSMKEEHNRHCFHPTNCLQFALASLVNVLLFPLNSNHSDGYWLYYNFHFNPLNFSRGHTLDLPFSNM